MQSVCTPKAPIINYKMIVLQTSVLMGYLLSHISGSHATDSCLCVSIHLCVYICVCVFDCASVHVCVYVCLHISVCSLSIRLLTSVYMCVYLNVSASICVFLCFFVYVFMCLCESVSVFICARSDFLLPNNNSSVYKSIKSMART